MSTITIHRPNRKTNGVIFQLGATLIGEGDWEIVIGGIIATPDFTDSELFWVVYA